MVNKVILIGNLGRDPEVRRFENGSAVAKFSVATNENYRDKNGEWQTLTEWHDVVAWRTLAERAETTLTKGGMVYVEGKLTTRTWQDQDGNNRRTTEVVANYFRAINKRDGARPMNSQPGYIPSPDDEIPTNATFETPPANTGFSSPGGEVPIVETGQSGSTPSADDDLPF